MSPLLYVEPNEKAKQKERLKLPNRDKIRVE